MAAEKKLPPGIRALERSDGSTVYQVRVRLKGHPDQVQTFPRLTDAKRWQVQTTAAIREGRHFTTVEAKKHTVAELIDRYLATVVPQKRTRQSLQRQQLEWWKEQIGSRRIADVTPALIVQYREMLASTPLPTGKQRSPATVNRYLAILSHAFTVATKEWQWTEDNPFLKVSKLKEPRGRVRFLSDDERQRLVAEVRRSNPALVPITLMAIFTGMRRDEIRELEWEDLDLERGRAIANRTKNDERRQVPIAGPALEAMRQWAKVRRLDTKLVFPSPSMPQKAIIIDKMFARAVKRAGIENFTFHDCRHTAASYLAMSGATLAEIAAILGHKTLAMVKRYAHLTDAHTATVVERMAAKFSG